jgi:uncharacterized protein (DUF2141 family)
MKKIWIWVILLFCINNIYADIAFTIEIHNVTVNGGTIYAGIYFNEQSFESKSPNIVLQIDPIHDIVLQEITLSEGEYVIGIHQDTNGNGEMEYGLFGIPKEPFGFSNMRGRIPGKFNQLKIRINNSNRKIIISLVKY